MFTYVVPGYGFVDFESKSCAEAAVKALQAKGIQAQMAKVGIPLPRRATAVRLLHEFFSYCPALPLYFLSHFCKFIQSYAQIRDFKPVIGII